MRPHALSWQTYALAALCAADLISTVWLCRVHNAAEANPIMAYFLTQGVLAFAAVKLVLTAAPLSLLEWVRRSRPKLAVLALNTALLGYLTLYGAGLAHLNQSTSFDEAAQRANQDPVYAVPLAKIQQRVTEKRRANLVELDAAQPAPGLGKALPYAPAVDTVGTAPVAGTLE